MPIEIKELQILTTKVVAAYLGNNTIATAEIPDLIHAVQGAFQQLSDGPTEELREELTPAVPIKKSVTPEFIICLEDGKKLKMLKRHLKTVYDLTPDDYRAKWGLPSDYPMVAPNYAKARSEMATRLGLGRKRA